MYSRIILVGRIVRKPTIKRKDNKLFANMTIAVNANGSEEADFFDLVAYDKTAELAEKYIDKGKPILVEGQPKIRKWEQKGEKHNRFEVHVSRLTFLPDKTPSQTADDFPPEGDDYPF